ncbi:hemerythrin domain-containing protein [Clostridium sp. SYSU_GA19001]|uniref:hemerythrin domain-containing protein n=1 Tax=Clostridium caldaquaticum TaxID=2940653 RepID=UPI0020776560|nr:hemerythrin domain-containing protein [Clostridium caldaquaticum]MCM8711320.1 hemerythrin domain-containing protein [Clostridium caldaquaticum]
MDAIELMVHEHENIKKMLKVIRSMCIKVVNNEAVQYEDFYKVIDFVRNYADKLHHAKEESILFKKMCDELGEKVAKGPIAGMLVEHDFGRLYMSNLENALETFKSGDKDARVDIIANAISYTDLLNRHIDKENTAIYTFARRALSKEAMKNIEKQCKEAEKIARENGIQKKYIDIIEEFNKKYL